MSKQVVILLHGVGSNGEDLSSLGDFWHPLLPNTLFLSPNAPFAFDQANVGYQWFSLIGVTAENRPQRIVEARRAFDKTIKALLAENNVDFATDKVVFVGFSQGSIMSLDALVSARYPLAGVVAFSGRLSSPQPYAKNSDTPVLLVHGQSDPVIPWTESQNAAKLLSQSNFNVEESYEPETEHTISSEGAILAAQFIQRCFA